MIRGGAVLADNDNMLTTLIAAFAIDGVPGAMVAHMTHGVNVTRWFCYEGAKRAPQAQGSYWLAQDAKWMKTLGIDYVRLCISPEYIFANGVAKAAELASIDTAIKKLQGEGMVVVWDLHDNGQMKLDAPRHQNRNFVTFWKSIATHYRGKGYSNLVFELVNEPVFQTNASAWHALQQQTVRAVRSVDPKRTIMVSGVQWGGIEGLEKLPVLPDHNLIYSAHCYDPFQFTHQGASWAGPEQQNLRNLPYPSSPEAVAAILPTIPEAQRKVATWYGEQRFNRSYLLGRLKKVSDWGTKHGKFVVLGEFGAYPPVSPAESRMQWFSDMAGIFAELKLSNVIWGYDDALGLGRKVENGTVILDTDTLSAFYHVK